jgi:uncharacterized protein YraI
MQARTVLSIAALAAATALSAPASAATTAEATTALNIRSGPGPQYPVVGMIKANDRAVIQGCIEGSLWCQVSYGGETGWAYSKYLTASVSGSTVVIADDRAAVGVPVVTYAPPPGTVGSAPVQVTGALVATPASSPPLAINPPPQVTTYVTANPTQRTYLDGEVVVGAGLPANVVVQPVPQYDYHYAYVNSVPVLVEPTSRRIVYVYR